MFDMNLTAKEQRALDLLTRISTAIEEGSEVREERFLKSRVTNPVIGNNTNRRRATQAMAAIPRSTQCTFQKSRC